jgi:hypothetical protein
MAKDKKSVLLYCDIIHTVEKLSNENAGVLFKHYLRYINDQNPEPPSDLIDIVFEPIKQNLKRDLKEWEKTKEGFSKGGKASAEKRSSLKLVEAPLSKSTVNVTVTDTVTVNDNVNVKDINLNEIFISDLENSSNLEAISINLKIPKQTLISKIPEFRKKMNVKYKDFNDFCNHFKNWAAKTPIEPTIKRKQL